MKNQKHLLSFCCLVVFVFLALASRVNRLHLGAFNYKNRVEDSTDTRDYALMNDGSKIYGEKVGWKCGLLVKNRVVVDDQKFKVSEVRGYQQNRVYYGRLGSDYIQRIVHGKINVYVQFSDVSSTMTDHSGFTHTSHYTHTDHYSQRGDDGPMVVFSSQKDIKALVAGCPIAEEMADKSDHQIRKAIRHNRNYLNDIFEIYNNDCKPLPENEMERTK